MIPQQLVTFVVVLLIIFQIRLTDSKEEKSLNGYVKNVGKRDMEN